MIYMHFDVFISVLSVMYRLLMYVFPYNYSALMALHTVLHVDTVLVAVALMIMTLLGPSPGLGRHSHCSRSFCSNAPCSSRRCCPNTPAANAKLNTNITGLKNMILN